MALTLGDPLGGLVARQETTAVTQQRPPGEPYTNAPRIIAIVATLTGISGLLVILRCYVRAFILRRFQLDDGIMIASQLCAFGVLACFVGECHHGVGRFSYDIPAADSAALSQWLWYHAIVIVLGISLAKISIGFFLLRFTSQNKLLKGIILGSLVFLVLFTLASIFTLIFQCLPVRAGWDYAYRVAVNAKCYSPNTYLSIGRFNSAINIITDFLFATLPVFMFYNVQVNRRTKASLMGILSLGYFACAAAIAKTVLQAEVFNDPESFRDSDFLIWNCLELNVGIIAACFPTIKPLVKSIIGSTRGLSYGSRSRKNTHNAYYGQTYGANSHAMGSMRRSRIDPEEDKYRVQIRAQVPSLDGSDGGSEENLPVKPKPHPRHGPYSPTSRIIQTTEVIVHSEDSGSDYQTMGLEPRRTVDDRI